MEENKEETVNVTVTIKKEHKDFLNENPDINFSFDIYMYVYIYVICFYSKYGHSITS